MPELPSFNTKGSRPTVEFTFAEIQSAYITLRNHVRVNESTKYAAGSHEAFRMLRLRSLVRKLETIIDTAADNQLRSDTDVNLDE